MGYIEGPADRLQPIGWQGVLGEQPGVPPLRMLGVNGWDPVGVRVADALVERMGPDPITGRPRESIDELRLRAARLHGGPGAIGRYLYAPR